MTFRIIDRKRPEDIVEERLRALQLLFEEDSLPQSGESSEQDAKLFLECPSIRVFRRPSLSHNSSKSLSGSMALPIPTIGQIRTAAIPMAMACPMALK